MSNLLAAEKIYLHMVALRRTLHRHPELAFEEAKTAAIIIEELERLQIPFDYGGVGGGIIARLNHGDITAPAIALRADMDALPGDETTGLPFASEHPGKMHACGHDGHMAMVLGTAALLKNNPPPGTVVFIFQPAEERGGGAKVMIHAGALKGVQAIFGGHLTRHYHVGEIMVDNGVMTAYSDGFTIRVHGLGGHGARPHEAVDAVVVTGLLITAVQTLVSREINPAYPSVVTIGKVEAGSAANVIAESATLYGTIRTTTPDVRHHIIHGLERITKAVGDLHNAKVEIEIREGYPPVINTQPETKIAQQAVLKTLGLKGLVSMEYPSMGAEDFSYHLKQVPGCYVRIGACREGWENIPLHSPSFDFDEEALKIGAAFFDQVVREAIAHYSP
jgi:amidohydrolase